MGIGGSGACCRYNLCSLWAGLPLDGAGSGALATPPAAIMCVQVTSGAAAVFFGLLAAFRRRLPRMQFRVASGPACLTGLLWSIGNFLSIYAVQVR